jgi:hypothetical protein
MHDMILGTWMRTYLVVDLQNLPFHVALVHPAVPAVGVGSSAGEVDTAIAAVLAAAVAEHV